MLDGLAEKITKSSYHDKETGTLFIQNPGISFEGLKALAKKHNFTIGQTKSGSFVSIPTNFKYSKSELDSISLYDDFMNTYTYYDKNYSTLLGAYKTFELMQENLSEVDLILDTYVGEVLAQGFVDNPLKIKISNTKAQTLIERIFYKNKIYERLPNITKALALYGNYGMTLSYPCLEKDIIDEVDIDKLDILEDLNISFINPKYFKVNVDEYKNVINYETENAHTFTSNGNATNTSVVNNRVWQPWQFVHFLLWSEITEPYGKSMLWSMRSAFDQLTTLEALLAISRAGKVQRLVFYVPLPNGVSMIDSYGFMNEFKGTYLNSIFADQGTAKAGRKLPGAMSILTLPVSSDGKKVEVDKIPECDIDLSSTEDIQYFLDKILRNSNLPKGYLVGEDTITTVQALEAQDLKLRRTLLPLKKGLLNGIMCLIENILTHAGYDVSTLDVEVSINEPIQLSNDIFEKYKGILELVSSFAEMNPTMPNINKFQLYVKLGLPCDLAKLVCSDIALNTLSNSTDLASFLLNKKLKPRGINTVGEEGEDLGETVSCKVTSKVFLNENYELFKQLNALKTVNDSSDRSLKETMLKSKKALLG